MSLKTKRKALVCIGLVLALLLACGLYAGDYYRADETALAALESTGEVTVTVEADRVIFAPRTPRAGLVFYPGGKVAFTAYAPLLQALAREDVLCVLLEMPLNLAVLDVHGAQGIPAEFPEIEDWYIAGHSLGGSMAASHAAGDEAFDGLILLAAYSTADLEGTALRVLSLRGSRDGVLDPEKYEKYRTNLPENTREVVLEGGNHANFGSYGPQEGDGAAALTSQEQRSRTAAEILAFLEAA